jgi:hypothetical protein
MSSPKNLRVEDKAYFEARLQGLGVLRRGVLVQVSGDGTFGLAVPAQSKRRGGYCWFETAELAAKASEQLNVVWFPNPRIIAAGDGFELWWGEEPEDRGDAQKMGQFFGYAEQVIREFCRENGVRIVPLGRIKNDGERKRVVEARLVALGIAKPKRKQVKPSPAAENEPVRPLGGLKQRDQATKDRVMLMLQNWGEGCDECASTSRRIRFWTMPDDLWLAVYADKPQATICGRCYAKRARKIFDLRARGFNDVVLGVARIVRRAAKGNLNGKVDGGAETLPNV